MKYNPRKITERVEKIKEIYRKTPVSTQKRPFYYSGDRWMSLYFLEGWKKYKDEDTTTMRRAKAEAEILRCSRPIIDNHELIVGKLDFLPYTEEQERRFESLYKAFSAMSPNISWMGREDHLALDYDKLLKLGVIGMMKEIQQKRASLSYSAETIAEDIAKEDFYNGCIVELNALLDYAQRYADYAEELARTTDGDRKRELLEIAENMRNVPAKPAQSFWQALQSIHFYTFSLFGLYPTGRPDRLLIEYYKRDIDCGRLTTEFAQELIDNYCLTFTTYNFSSASNGFMIGGTDSEGNSVENDLTYMFLTSGDHLRLPDPNIGLCVSEKTSDEIIRYGIEMISSGCTQPAFYNDNEIVSTLIKQGVKKHDAHNYINTTCVEISIAGKSNMWTTCPWINITEGLMEIIEEKDEYKDFDTLFEEYADRLKRRFTEDSRFMARLQLERSRNGSMPLRTSCLVEDCIERGRSIDAGGAVYNRVFPAVLGFANTVDSLYALKDLVFESKRYNITEIREILKSNYKDNEELRQYIIKKLPHYGNGDERCDSIAVKLSEKIVEICKKLPTFRGDITVPSVFSFNVHIMCGAETGATLDGRKAGEPLADSSGAMQGYDTDGPTSMINSVTSWENSAFLGGIALNMKYDKNYVSADNMFVLIKTFFQKGGIQIQLNCVDRETLEDAIVNPDRHRNLVVRIGGYSDYFVNLSEKLQREILSRTGY